MSRSARHRTYPKPADYPPIPGFHDACQAALVMAEQFKRGHAALVLGDGGKVLNACVLVAKHHDPYHALTLVSVGPPEHFLDRDVLLISMRGTVDDGLPNGIDVAHWYRLVDGTKRRGARLVDWMHVGAGLVRSMRLAEEPSTRGRWFGTDDDRAA